MIRSFQKWIQIITKLYMIQLDLKKVNIVNLEN